MKKLSWTKDQRRRAGAFLGLALLCGLTLLYCLVNILTIDRFGTAYSPDEENYIDMARNLLEHGYYSYWGGEPDAYVSPGYPVFLTLCMALFGTDLPGIFPRHSKRQRKCRQQHFLKIHPSRYNWNQA